MLELEGWSVASNERTAIDVIKDAVHLSIAVRPALRAVESDPREWERAVVLSEYEIRKDLPSCLLKIQ
jgi:hypothetical protein